MVDMDHSDSDEFAGMDLAANLFALVTILYLLVRHVLMQRGDLQGDDFLCGDCSKACVNSLKGPCTDERKPERTSHEINTGEDSKFYNNVIYYCTFGCMLSYMCYNINASMHDLTLYEWLPFGYCHYAIPIGGVSVITAKSNLYAVLVSRLHLAFHGSGAGYNTKLIHAMLASVFVIWLFLTLIAAILSTGKRIEEGNVNHKICRVMVPDIEFGTMSAFDFCYSIAVAYMFISALRRLLAARRKPLDQRQIHESKGQKEAVFYALIQKYAVLTTVAILSTLLTLVFFILFVAGYLLALNGVVDCVSILFMTGNWQPVYEEVCGPLLRCAVNTPCLPCVDVSLMEERELAEETVTIVSSKPRITPSLLVLAPTKTLPRTVPI